jgi:hypothetical protein
MFNQGRQDWRGDDRLVRLIFGRRPDQREEQIAEHIAILLDEMQDQRNIWSSRQAAYDPEWDWRRITGAEGGD